jgi:hypothetical protein
VYRGGLQLRNAGEEPEVSIFLFLEPVRAVVVLIPMAADRFVGVFCHSLPLKNGIGRLVYLIAWRPNKRREFPHENRGNWW